MKKKRKSRKPKATDFTALGLQGAERCMWDKCKEKGLYPAPKSPFQAEGRRQNDDFFWFCLDHVRDYNQRWDYFRGMSETEVRHFQKEAVTGHRPTWKMGLNGKFSAKKLDEAIEKFAFLLEDTGYYPPEYPPEGKEALAVLELTYPVTQGAIKTRYRELVKKFHPDKNQGKKAAEERFKAINEAYQYLKNCGYFPA